MFLTESTEFTESNRWFYFFRFAKKLKPTFSSFFSVPSVSSVRANHSGVALIMVLGLLTVMVLLAVTFAISMRTERLAAGNAADTVRARQLTHVALARALDDLRAMFHMPDRFVVDNNKLVLLGPEWDYEVDDEVQVFSPGTLPLQLSPGTTYTIGSKWPDKYTVGLSGIPTLGSGDCKVGLNISDSYDDGKVSSNLSYVVGTPIIFDKLTSSQLRYVVPVDDTSITLASTYSNALQGNIISPQPSGSHTLELLPVHGIYPVMTIQSDPIDNQLVYISSRQRLRTGMAVRLEGTPLSANTPYYIRCVRNELILGQMNWFVQLCDSYKDALKNTPRSLSGAFANGLIIPIPTASPHSPAFASYGTNAVVSLSDFSEQLTPATFDSVNDTVNVANRYRSGAAVAFTKNTPSDTLPSPLNERTAYYVIPIAGNKIQLAETLDKALAAVPEKIDLTSVGTGTFRIYELGLSGEATNYIPIAVYANAASALASATSNGFFEIRTTNADLMGKVRYAIVDCSGLLDANYVGGDSRTYGNNPREYQLANLPDPNASVIPTERDQLPMLYKRYETLRDLYQSVRPSNTFVYSYSLPEQWDTNLMILHTPLNIGMNNNGDTEMLKLIGKYSAITNGLCMAGFTLEEAGVVFSNLIDFVDGDVIPSNQECCVENVPMINEVVACCYAKKDNLGGGQFQYTIKYFLTNEFCFPFVDNPSIGFTNMSTVTFALPEDPSLKPNNLAFSVTPITNTSLVGGFVCLTREANNGSPSPIVANNYNTLTLIATIWLSNSVNDASGNKIIVDQIITPITLTHSIDFSSGDEQLVYAGVECLDPRFNSNPGDTAVWRQEGNNNTLWSINTWAAAHLYGSQPAAPTLPTNDCDSAMYVGNRPLRSVSELGYLVYSPKEPWRTVKLYGPDRHRVLDVFAIAKNANDRFAHNIYNRGQINPNTRSLAVLKAWFAGMPVDKYQGQSGAHTLNNNDTEAGAVAQLFVNQAGSYTNLSEIGRVFDDTTKFPYPMPYTSASELERESYFRNTCGLFNVHQSVFTILLEAKVASGGNIPKNPARQRAVAIVWRDPYTGEMFVRHLKWLSD